MHGAQASTRMSAASGFGLGCAGTCRNRLAPLNLRSNVLLVVIHGLTLAFRPDEMTKSNIIATALFGDRAAACVLSIAKTDGLAAIEFSGEHGWPTLDIMGCALVCGFSHLLAISLPELRAAAGSFLGRNGLSVDISQFVFHPGGMVISALEQVFNLDQGTLEIGSARCNRSRLLYVSADSAVRAQGGPAERSPSPASGSSARWDRDSPRLRHHEVS